MQLCLHKVVERVCAAVVLRLERCALEVRVSMETCQALGECEESHTGSLSVPEWLPSLPYISVPEWLASLQHGCFYADI